MNSYYYGRREYNRTHEDYGAFVLVLLGCAILGFGVYILTTRLHLRPRQLVEAAIDLGCLAAAEFITFRHFWTFNQRRSETWPHPTLPVPLLKDRKAIARAFAEDSIVAGYSIKGQPWNWSDDIRRMQALLLGMSGSGKTTLLAGIIAQDLRRVVREGHRIPIIIIDGKADRKLRKAVEHEVAAAGRSHQFRVLDPTQPAISVRWNPLSMSANSYHEHVNFIFESFGLRRDFFKGHQYTYFGDLVRVLYYAGKRFNIYDVLVVAQDQQVLEEQIEIARGRIEGLYSPHDQRRLNFEMSTHNLIQSFASKERVEKIQGLLNELMTFVQDDLSVVTGPYEDLLSLEDVIDQELVLYVSLNVSLNTRAVTALGQMLLHNLQLLAGKRYQSEDDNPSFVSVIMDEFSPLAYPEFAHVIQTARGSNIAILFSLQSVAQLERVSRTFCDDVCSAPNTVMLLRCRNDEETAKYFMSSSSLVQAKRRTMTVEETGIIEKQAREIGFGSDTYIMETRAKDEQIRNLPLGQFQVLVTNNKLGTEFFHLQVRRPPQFELNRFRPMIFPRTQIPNIFANGANLRFKDPALIERRTRFKGRASQPR